MIMIILYLIMGKKSINNDKVAFFDAIRGMRKLVGTNTKPYVAETLGVSKKGVKVPYNHLMGRRTTIKKRFKQEKEKAREENIQYASNMNLFNSRTMRQYNDQGKDEFMRNQYKFKGSATGRIGKEKDGFLELSRQDIRQIYSKPGPTNRQPPKHKKPFRKNKSSKRRK